MSSCQPIESRTRNIMDLIYYCWDLMFDLIECLRFGCEIWFKIWDLP